LKSGQTFTLADVLGTFTNPNHYDGVLPLGISPDAAKNADFILNSQASRFTTTAADTLASLLNVYTAQERVSSGYAAYTLDAGMWHWVAGVRVEQTSTEYTANKAVTDKVTKLTSVTPVAGNGSYVNFFPSAQLRLGLDEQTNLRVAVTTGIARPAYGALSPRVSITPGAAATDPNAINLGNPDLKPTRSVNYDVLVEHFSSDVGVAQIGVFYKQLSDFIFNKTFIYQGAPYDGYSAIQPQNGKNGYIYGVEGAFVRRLAFLPGVLNGFGVDANATYTQSKSHVDGRDGLPFPRQANWNGNAALTYAKGIVSSRVTMQYNGPYIYTLGDGTNSVATGDTYMMAHKQVDASLNLQVQRNSQIILQVLNINNAPFGYFFARDPNAYKQREFYGTTTSLQFRYTY
jgi:TonB-dependent receptor